uniref:Receptor for retinol uptake STRA6 n=1 Tax=Alexandrium catenella TaxID=2925 RepID=A0A7S1WMM3_ALECA
MQDAGQTFKEYSEARGKDVAMDLAKEEAKQLGVLAAQQLAAAAEGKVKEATKAGEAQLREKAHDLVADRLKQLDSASRERLGNFTTNFIEKEMSRYQKAAEAKLSRMLNKMVDKQMEQIKRDLEAQLPDVAKDISHTLNLGIGPDRRLKEGKGTARVEEANVDEEETNVTETKASPPKLEEDTDDGQMISSVIQNIRDTASPFVSLFLTVVNILQQDWIAWALIGIKVGVRISLICAICCELYVMARAFRKYRELFESMQAGRHDYLGHESRDSLAEGFAETTMFPGVFLGTSVIGFALVAVVTFVAILVLVLLLVPQCAMQWLSPYWPVIKYLILTLALKKFVQMVLMDWLLVDGGDIVYPGVFSLIWFIQLFLNFVIGLSMAITRAVVVVFVAALSCCFVDFTLLPEPLVSLDTAYYSLLAMAYTHHERRNPVKMAAVTVLNSWVHRVHAPKRKAPVELELPTASAEHAEGEQPATAGRASPGLLRARARFLLLLTLHRNPELRRFRKPQVQLPRSHSTLGDLLAVHGRSGI